MTWMRTSAPSDEWTSVASSADGTRLVASAGPFSDGNGAYIRQESAIYCSSDAGATWIRTSATNNWTCVASSADGSKLAAATRRYTYYFSDYYGQGLFVAGLGDGGIYHSSDSGTNWIRTSAPTRDWLSVASSADGTILVAVGDYEPEISVSTNSGASWVEVVPPGPDYWNCVTCSADGNSLVVAVGAHIAALHAPNPAPPVPPSPQLAVNLSGGNLNVSWLVPSTPFVLQQTSDLRLSGWVDVLASPTLNLTNLHYQLTVTPGLGKSFYRLAQQ
jgi:photosystem II stability/assembly factor-like uncharacterized protein